MAKKDAPKQQDKSLRKRMEIRHGGAKGKTTGAPAEVTETKEQDNVQVNKS